MVGAKACYVFPTQMGPLGNLRRLATYWELLFLMVGRDLKARYTQSMLGFYWAVLNPLVHGLIFTVIFSIIVRVDSGDTSDRVLNLCDGVLTEEELVCAREPAVSLA